MDCNMPIMDGYAATKILKEKMNKKEIPFIKIIAHTAYSKENHEEKFEKYGFDDYLPKPFLLKQLKEKLAGLFELK